MDSQFPGKDPPPPKRQLQLQGPRPSPLKVNKDSHKIKKPPHPPPHRTADAAADARRREPLIIYDVSPRVIHAEEAEFMSIVQRYTGLSSGNFSVNGDISPAARLAATEKASPSPRDKVGNMEGVMEEDFIRTPHGILSPAPETLPAVSAETFFPATATSGTFLSPASEARLMSALHDWSPAVHGSGYLPSPSALFSAPLISSPTLSSDFFAPIWNP